MIRYRSWLAAVLAMVMLLSMAASVGGAGNDQITGEHVEGQVIVQFKDSTPAAERARIMAAHGLTQVDQIFGTETLVLEGRGKSAAALVKALANNPNVEYAEPNYIAKVDWVPNDTSWSQQWGPQKVSAPAAWDYTRGSSSVVIAVVDTGVDLNHPDLSGKILAGYNFVSNNTNAQDDNGHGTHVAGIAAAVTNNSRGIAGMCPNCSILPVKVLSSSGSGTYAAIASGIRWAADRAQVINLSLGGTSGSTALSDAVNYANSKGRTLACAAGNSNTSAASYPAYYAPCIAVASTDSGDYKSSFSNYGSWVDTSAPGSNIYATYWNDTYKSLNGTSMAAPHVAGLAGLLWSQGRTQSDIRTRLTSSTYTDPVNSTNIPRRINAYKAVAY